MTDTRRIAITVNGNTYERRVETRLTLGDFLRHELRLTGTHLGCEHGVCGACTVLVDGRSTPGLLMTLTEFLNDTPQPTAADVRDAITGHLCRCTGYQSIVEAALLAAERGRKS